MADRTKFNDLTAADGGFSEGIERFLSEKDLAETHVIGRNRRMAEFLCFLSLVRGRLAILGVA